MSINPIGITNPNQATAPNSIQTQMQQAMAPVASLFGETADQLMQQLNSGSTSLSQLASQKGISQTDLVNAIKQGLQQTASANGQSPSDTQLTNIANRIANHKHGGHHHHGGGGGAAAVGSTPSTTDPSATSSTSSTSPTDELLQLLESQSQATNQAL